MPAVDWGIVRHIVANVIGGEADAPRARGRVERGWSDWTAFEIVTVRVALILDVIAGVGVVALAIVAVIRALVTVAAVLATFLGGGHGDDREGEGSPKRKPTRLHFRHQRGVFGLDTLLE